MNGRTKQTVLSCILLAVVTLAVYSPVRGYPFINYDDQQYVTRNAYVQQGLTWKTWSWAWTATDAYNWHPITWLSHALDWQLYGSSPVGHHITSLLLHCLNVLVLFLLILWSTGRLGRSLTVAALFALSPLNVESVVWIAERKNLLSALFFLIALGVYGWYAIRPGLLRYLLVAFFFALGLASKPMAITLPFVLFLLDFWPLQRLQGPSPEPPPSSKPRKDRKAHALSEDTGVRFPVSKPLSALILEKVPLVLLSLGSAVITVVAQRSGGAVRSLERIPLWLRIENAICSYAMYVWKELWPAGLALYYPLSEPPLWKLGLAILFLMAVSMVAWKQRITRRYLLTGWLWYLGTLVPVIGILQVGDQAMADRYAYVSLIGIFVMAVWSLADYADSLKVSLPVRAVFAVAVLAVFSFLTWKQHGYWRSSLDVWSHTVDVTGPNPLAESDLGDALHAMGRPADALPHFQNAVSMQSNDPVRHIDLAEDLAECGRLQDAIVEYESAIPLTTEPDKQAHAYQSLAILYGELGEYGKARDSYRQLWRIDSQVGEETIRNLSKYFATNPSGAGYLSLGMLLEAAGRVSEARAAYEQALKLDPTLAEARESIDTIDRGHQ
jgi:tetratricopeptide (TPR) repeat protein